MVHLPKRHFFQSKNEKHWSKEKRMGGPEYRILTPEEIAGYVTVDPVQETIDSLNAAIARLDGIIKEMQDNCECKN
jgi:hypothetical protein